MRLLVAPPTHTHTPCQLSSRSTLEDIEERSQALLAKGIAARFIDKGEDSKEVARLVKRLREAVSHYQVSGHQFIASNAVYIGEEVSQQQAIYDQIANLTVRVPRLTLPSCADDRFFYQVVLRSALETP